MDNGYIHHFLATCKNNDSAGLLLAQCQLAREFFRFFIFKLGRREGNKMSETDFLLDHSAEYYDLELSGKGQTFEFFIDKGLFQNHEK